jgi:serine/threonine protein phosphatase PrpC
MENIYNSGTVSGMATGEVSEFVVRAAIRECEENLTKLKKKIENQSLARSFCDVNGDLLFSKTNGQFDCVGTTVFNTDYRDRECQIVNLETKGVGNGFLHTATAEGFVGDSSIFLCEKVELFNPFNQRGMNQQN